MLYYCKGILYPQNKYISDPVKILKLEKFYEK